MKHLEINLNKRLLIVEYVEMKFCTLTLEIVKPKK